MTLANLLMRQKLNWAPPKQTYRTWMLWAYLRSYSARTPTPAGNYSKLETPRQIHQDRPSWWLPRQLLTQRIIMVLPICRTRVKQRPSLAQRWTRWMRETPHSTKIQTRLPSDHSSSWASRPRASWSSQPSDQKAHLREDKFVWHTDPPNLELRWVRFATN